MDSSSFSLVEKLRPKTIDALNKWLSQETWYKDHQFDTARFFAFVDGLHTDISTLDGYEAELGKLMREVWRKKHGKSEMQGAAYDVPVEIRERLQGFVRQIWVILDFLKWRVELR